MAETIFRVVAAKKAEITTTRRSINNVMITVVTTAGAEIDREIEQITVVGSNPKEGRAAEDEMPQEQVQTGIIMHVVLARQIRIVEEETGSARR